MIEMGMRFMNTFSLCKCSLDCPLLIKILSRKSDILDKWLLCTSDLWKCESVLNYAFGWMYQVHARCPFGWAVYSITAFLFNCKVIFTLSLAYSCSNLIQGVRGAVVAAWSLPGAGVVGTAGVVEVEVSISHPSVGKQAVALHYSCWLFLLSVAREIHRDSTETGTTWP